MHALVQSWLQASVLASDQNHILTTLDIVHAHTTPQNAHNSAKRSQLTKCSQLNEMFTIPKMLTTP